MRRAVRLNLFPALLVAALAAGCAYLPAPEGPAPMRYRDAVFTTVDETPDLVYGEAPDPLGNPVTLKLDLFEPHGDDVTDRPALVLVHGGGFAAGDKNDSKMVDLARHFAARGYVAVTINYRLKAGAGCDQPIGGDCTTAAVAAQHDAQAAVRWLRANAGDRGVDPGRIAIGGTSAGAITSLLVAYRSDDPGDSGNPGEDSTVRAAISISGGLPVAGQFIEAGEPSSLLFHGTADPAVPYLNSYNVLQTAEAAGVTVYLETLLDAGHVAYDEYGGYYKDQITNFLYTQLGFGPAPVAG